MSTSLAHTNDDVAGSSIIAADEQASLAFIDSQNKVQISPALMHTTNYMSPHEQTHSSNEYSIPTGHYDYGSAASYYHDNDSRACTPKSRPDVNYHSYDQFHFYGSLSPTDYYSTTTAGTLSYTLNDDLRLIHERVSSCTFAEGRKTRRIRNFTSLGAPQ